MAVRAILDEILLVPGVRGAFLLDAQGSVVAMAFEGALEKEKIAEAGQVLSRTLAGLATRGPASALDLVYAEARLLVKSLGAGSLLVLCGARINPTLLDLTVGPLLEPLRLGLQEETARTPSAARREAL